MSAEKVEEKEEKSTGFDYENKASFKLSNKFKEKFYTKTAGGPTLSADGLVALGHIKGMWKCDVEILQYPSAENNNTCICKAVVGGYDWDPIEKKVIRVEYSDIGDANPSNCNRMVGPAFIRMASTRALGRALRKYTNVDMLCTEELSDDDIATTSMMELASQSRVTQEQLLTIKGIVSNKGINQGQFVDILKKTFFIDDFQALNIAQANQLIEILNNYIPTSTK